MRWSQCIWFLSWSTVIKDVDAIVGSQNTCYYPQYLEPGQYIYLTSPGYPNYASYDSCQWEVHTATGAIIRAECDHLEVQDYSNFCRDYLRLSTKGTTTTHCEPFTIVGDNSIRLTRNPSNSQVGRFRCVFIADKSTSYPNQQPSQGTSDDRCDCGWNRQAISLRIVGGEVAKINEFSSMALFVHVESRDTWCGGTIISRNAILTAAHCTDNQNPTEYAVLIGEHDISKTSETSETTLVKVQSFIAHPKHNTASHANDIALAITSPIRFTAYVGPACLPFNFITPLYTYVTVAGWGTDSFGGAKSNVLMKANLRIIPPNYCVQTYDHFDQSTQLCTFFKGKDACQYDSGGPLYVYNDKGNQFVIGVVSHGKDCAQQYPAVNTRVAAYVDWIQANLPSERLCRKY